MLKLHLLIRKIELNKLYFLFHYNIPEILIDFNRKSNKQKEYFSTQVKA